jgi:hypothetical protein
MRTPIILILLVIFFFTITFSQVRDYRIHTRGMLRQTVYNTGEIGRAFDNGTSGIIKGFPSMEWPPNSYQIIDHTPYSGQHNSFGGGLWVAGTRDNVRRYEYCGAVTDNNGFSVPVENIYSFPISIDRTENFPLLPNGNINLSYNPNEAEEIITAKWNTPDSSGVHITRTSRAWSFPGYDNFIIYEYELENTTSDTLYDVFVAFPYGFMTSMFGYERKYNRWAEADSRVTDQYARYDFRRYMTYNHDRTGKPDTGFFNDWSTPGNRGGLNSPQAAGLVMLHYDYDHLAVKGQTQLVVTGADTMSWDENNKLKQPFLNRYENGNLYPSKTQLWLDPSQGRKTRPFRLTSDSLFLKAVYGEDPVKWKQGYWLGRSRPSTDLANTQPSSHGYGFGPYTLPTGEKIRFAVAEVVGYGPGIASDSVYKDLGGGIRYIDSEPLLNPIPSWYKTLTYPGIGTSVMGSDYLQTHPLPWYVTPGVVSIRDVADRAIQMYTGGNPVKYDTLQFEPETTPEYGTYNTTSIPVPAPTISVENTSKAFNKIIWGPQVEEFNTPRLKSPFKHYEVMRSPHPLGPWSLIDTVFKRDARYFLDSIYAILDTSSLSGNVYYYVVVTVDSTGGRSGMTNITAHETPVGIHEPDKTSPSLFMLEQNYPNPFNPLTQIKFSIDRKAKTTLELFNLVGQKVLVLFDDVAEAGRIYNVDINASNLSSGCYFYRLKSENRIQTKKLLLLK